MKRNKKPGFSELIDSLQVLCRAEKGSDVLCSYVSQAVGNYEDAQTYLGMLTNRTENAVIRMLAKEALKAR